MSPRRRRFLSRLLAGLAVFALLLGTTAAYAERAIFDPDRFSDRAVSVLDDDAVRSQIAAATTDAVVNEQPNAIAARPLIEAVAEGLVGSTALQTLLQSGIADVHRTVIEGDQDTLTVTLNDIGVLLRSALETAAPKLAKKIPRTLDADVLTSGGDPEEGFFIDVSQIAEHLKVLHWVGLALALALAAGSIALAPTRLAGLRRIGRALTIGSVIAILVWQVGRLLTTAPLEGDTADAVRAIWNAFLGDLRVWFVVLAGAGIVITAGASSTREPIDLRARVARVWAWFTRVPERTSLRVVRAVLLILIGIWVIQNRDTVVEITVIVLALFLLDAGASEVMRMAAGRVRAEQEAGPTAEAAAEADLGGGALARGVLVGVLLFGGILFLGTRGGEDERPPLRVRTCNGSVKLCGRTLDQVVFPATHNSMSGATYRNWFFAQHEQGISQQLEAGIRGLLVDPHYGVETPDGVATDLEADKTSRAKLEGSLGPEGVAAAERIRAQIGFTGDGEREVFLCHGFCEVGAIPAEKGFREVADFLTANPGEVVVMSIEDATSPKDTVAALEAAGLDEFAYRGPNGPWPTLREMIDSNERLLVMAERDGGEPPWYRDQFEITQETPFKFTKPEQLEKRSSCRENRGPSDAPFFLLNHWVDSSPAPRPSNAKIVNQKQFLLDRVAMCERVRGIQPNILAVDFFREGDVVGAANELNGIEDG
jgi:hypothetical protein